MLRNNVMHPRSVPNICTARASPAGVASRLAAWPPGRLASLPAWARAAYVGASPSAQWAALAAAWLAFGAYFTATCEWNGCLTPPAVCCFAACLDALPLRRLSILSTRLL